MRVGTAAEPEQTCLSLFFSGDGRIVVSEGGRLRGSMQYEYGEWYEISVGLDWYRKRITHVSVDGKNVVEDIAFYSPVDYVDHIFVYNLSDSTSAEWEQIVLESSVKFKCIYKESKKISPQTQRQSHELEGHFPQNDELDRALKKWSKEQIELQQLKHKTSVSQTDAAAAIIKSPWQRREHVPEPYIWDHKKSVVENASRSKAFSTSNNQVNSNKLGMN